MSKSYQFDVLNGRRWERSLFKDIPGSDGLYKINRGGVVLSFKYSTPRLLKKKEISSGATCDAYRLWLDGGPVYARRVDLVWMAFGGVKPKTKRKPAVKPKVKQRMANKPKLWSDIYSKFLQSSKGVTC